MPFNIKPFGEFFFDQALARPQMAEGNLFFQGGRDLRGATAVVTFCDGRLPLPGLTRSYAAMPFFCQYC
jgi:hypothetical protein